MDNLKLDTNFIERHAALLAAWLRDHEPTRQQLAVLAALVASIDKAGAVVVGVGERKEMANNERNQT